MAIISRTELFSKLKTSTPWNVPVTISRQSPLPTTSTEVFESIEAATTYVQTDATAYPGQILSVLNSDGTNSYWGITQAGELESITGASSPMQFVANEAAMLALTDIDAGQQVFREDTKTIWIYKGGETGPSDINNWVETSSDVVLSWDSVTGTIKSGDSGGAILTGVAHDPSYDGTARKLTIPVYGSESPIEVTIPDFKDKVVTSGEYHDDFEYPVGTHHYKVIVLTIANQTEPVIIPAESLVNVYTADNTGKNVEITISDDYKISANISLAGTADDAGKILVASTDGKSIEYGSTKLSELATTAAITESLKTKRDIVTPTVDGVLVYAATKNGDTVTQGNLVVGNVANGLVRFDDGRRIQLEVAPINGTDAVNKSYVDTAIDGVTFENKAVLAAITQEKVDAWDANVTYINGKKTILDAITEDKITEWDNKLSTVPVDNVSIELNSSQEVAVKAVNVNKLDQTAGDELILDGGTAN